MAQDTAGVAALTWEQRVLSVVPVPLPVSALLLWGLAFGCFVASSWLRDTPILESERELAMTIFTLYLVNIPALYLVSAYPLMAGVIVLSVVALVGGAIVERILSAAID